MTRDPERAIKHFEKVLVLQPDNPAASYQLGLLYYRKGDNSAATDVLRSGLARNPDNTLIRDLLKQIEANPSPDLSSD
jgi:predicted Zn-dependent protease